MQIQAVATKPTFDIQAAMASPDYRGVEHIIHASGIGERLASGPLPVAEIDAALSKSKVSTSDRIALKSALGRCGLLK
jgi:hypothetical protein